MALAVGIVSSVVSAVIVLFLGRLLRRLELDLSGFLHGLANLPASAARFLAVLVVSLAAGAGVAAAVAGILAAVTEGKFGISWLLGMGIAAYITALATLYVTERDVTGGAIEWLIQVLAITLIGLGLGLTGWLWSAHHDVEPDMLLFDGGTFLLGGQPTDNPEATKQVGKFYLSKTEVTNAEYEKFVSRTGTALPSQLASGRVNADLANRPVVNVTWHDAESYCRWANGRLPTEIEWERAARYDHSASFGLEPRTWPWVGSWDPSKLNWDNVLGRSTDVGSYPFGGTPDGLLDMAGNVWEWTSSAYLEGETGQPQTEGSSNKKTVIRGGSWANEVSRESPVFREWRDYDTLSDKTGIRCAQDAQ